MPFLLGFVGLVIGGMIAEFWGALLLALRGDWR